MRKLNTEQEMFTKGDYKISISNYRLGDLEQFNYAYEGAKTL